VCQEYTLRYVFVCSIFLTFYCIGVFAASEVSYQSCGILCVPDVLKPGAVACKC
jgi:hypothetical protein